MSLTLTLGLDVGTQGTKGVVLDLHTSAVVARAARSYDLLPPAQPGAAEQHPEQWLDAAREVVGELLAHPDVTPSALVALAVSGQQHGLVVLDEHDAVIRPAKLWCDTSTARQAAALSERLGRAVPTGFTASKIAWLAEREPEHWARTRRVLLPHDYLNFVLTGRACMEAGDASGTGCFDPVTRRFEARAVDAVDPRLAECLPELVAPGVLIGEVSAAGAARLGVPAGLPVATGSGDNMMSAFGSGATQPGVAVVSLGTSGTLFAQSAAPVLDPAGLIAPFCDATGAWLPLLCVMNCTGVLEEVRAAFPGSSHDALSEAAAQVAPGSDGLLMLPYLQGERVPDLPHARGALLGLRPGLLRADRLYRAAMEGVSLNLALGAARLRALDVPVNSVRVVGGAARNALWLQILADCLDAPVQRLAEAESAALGAALCAAWSWRRAQGDELSAHELATPCVQLTGEPVRPDVQRVALYAQLRDEFASRTEQLFGLTPSAV
ncbi:MAG: xylulose kinase [Planctomycetota bacterium]|nr:MAG: xylulose kinase [Planctomycetota bacterium]